jgi:23S rRNA (cytosine1962-C5)-methyltransferase
MKSVTLRKTKRILAGHLWVFSNEISDRLPDYEPGEIVELQNSKKEYLATAYINPHSLIAARILSRKRRAIDQDFIRERLGQAIDYRKQVLPSLDSCRLLFGEADLMPGLIIDKYADVIVIQALTAGMDHLLESVMDVVEELLSPTSIVLRNDSHFRALEGLQQEKRVARGQLQNPIISEGGLKYAVDPVNGQKTGFFLDQRENRQAFARLVQGGTGLDLFSYAGAWALPCAGNGAQITCVDSSRQAVDTIHNNIKLNKLEASVQAVCQDVFAYLQEQRQENRVFDFVVLDPPAFAKSKSSLRNAIKAYQNINAAAMSTIRPGGLLASSSCSHHISPQQFLEILQHAAAGLSRYVRLVELRYQAKDHPSLVSMPETHYLKCAILQVL